MAVNDYCVSYGTYYSYLKRSVPKLLNPHPVPEVMVDIKHFNDGEISVKFGESLRGKHIFIFGETTHNLTELIMTLDAAKRCSAEEVTVVLPYFGYSRQDKREGTRGCIGAKAVAHVIESMGVDRVISIDLHAAQIQAYFQVPFEHLSGINIFKNVLINEMDRDFVFVTPDAGGTLRALKFASFYGKTGIATINKRRDKPGVISHMELTGDVKDKVCIIVDDIADTCGTICKASDLLLENGAAKTFGLLTHPVLTGDWMGNIEMSSLSTMLISNTLNVHAKLDQHLHRVIQRDNVSFELGEKIKVVSCIDLLEKTIDKIAHDQSISDLN